MFAVQLRRLPHASFWCVYVIGTQFARIWRIVHLLSLYAGPCALVGRQLRFDFGGPCVRFRRQAFAALPDVDAECYWHLFNHISPENVITVVSESERRGVDFAPSFSSVCMESCRWCGPTDCVHPHGAAGFVSFG